jgi:hypothetical protein
MNKSESIGELVAALAQAQAEFKPIEKDKEAKVASKTGASFSYHYADLASCVDATRPALAKNGLAVIQPIRRTGGDVVVTSILAHASGEWISEEMSWPGGADSRSIGSAATYARRYGYLAIVGAVARDEDDDAEAATQKPAAQPRQQPAPKPASAKLGPEPPGPDYEGEDPGNLVTPAGWDRLVWLAARCGFGPDKLLKRVRCESVEQVMQSLTIGGYAELCGNLEKLHHEAGVGRSRKSA